MNQTTEIMPETEKLVVDWANYHGFIVKPRKWRQQKVEETQAMHKIGIAGANFGLGIFDACKDSEVKRLDRLMIGDEAYQREIFVPNGLIVYGLVDDGRNIQSEQELEKFLNSKELYNIELNWYLGPSIPNWQSEHCTAGERKMKADEIDSLILISDGSVGNGVLYDDGKTARERVAGLLREFDRGIRIR